jgi:glyoxylase-like metal-dependent hydrolase (beta-lactamase superfamily II)
VPPAGEAALMAPGEDLLATAAEQGVHALPIPTPFAVGRVNTYLIEDEPLTLIDSGPNSGKALDELEQALDRRGRKIEEIGLVVLTHQHIDHIGLAAIIARRSGAEVAALDRLAPLLARHSEELDRDDRFATLVMRRHGIPEDVVGALRAVSASFRSWGSSVAITRPLRDGDLLELRDRKLRVLHRPGHSPSDTVFWDERRATLIAGDHLLKHISSNPLIALPLGARPVEDGEGADHGRRPQALVTYLASLRATRELPAELVLGGHGDPIGDHRGLIDERFRMHERRAEGIFELIRERPRSAYEIAHALWGNVAVTQAYLTLSEVLGHADLLLNDGRIQETIDDGVVRFEAVG